MKKVFRPNVFWYIIDNLLLWIIMWSIPIFLVLLLSKNIYEPNIWDALLKLAPLFLLSYTISILLFLLWSLYIRKNISLVVSQTEIEYKDSLSKQKVSVNNTKIESVLVDKLGVDWKDAGKALTADVPDLTLSESLKSFPFIGNFPRSQEAKKMQSAIRKKLGKGEYEDSYGSHWIEVKTESENVVIPTGRFDSTTRREIAKALKKLID